MARYCATCGRDVAEHATVGKGRLKSRVCPIRPRGGGPDDKPQPYMYDRRYGVANAKPLR